MKTKITIDFIRDWLIKNTDNILCLDNYCPNGNYELNFKCSKNHTFSKTFNNFKKRPNCPHCTGKYKYTYNDVKTYIESVEGYILLSQKYINCKEKLIIQCDNNHEFPMSFDEFKNSNYRCPYCNIGGSYKYNLEIAKQIFYDSGCELLVNEYKNCDTPMEYICECGNASKISLKMFQSGQRCQTCGNKKIGDALRTPYSEIVQLFKENDCQLLTTESEIKNGKTKVKYICSCGNPDEVTIEKFKSGERCNICKQKRVQQVFLEKYGTTYALSNPDIREKIKQTLYNNGTAPCSNQQEYLCNLFNGELNYPLKTLSLDIAFPKEMIYVEYDGGLHEGQVIFGNKTPEEFAKEQRNRTYGLLRSGWKEVRIISRKDYLPQDNKILELIEYARNYLNSGHHYIKFDIDNGKIINSQGEIDYDYGELRKITNKDLQEAI